MKKSTHPILILSSLLALSLAATAETLPSSLPLCEEKTKLFLKSDYSWDKSVARTFMTPEFAALWIKANTHNDDGITYWNSDPILETQDEDPALLGIGPTQLQDDGTIHVPVGYQHRHSDPYTKVFVFEQRKGRWLIGDIITNGVVNPSTGEVRSGESTYEDLKKNLGGE